MDYNKAEQINDKYEALIIASNQKLLEEMIETDVPDAFMLQETLSKMSEIEKNNYFLTWNYLIPSHQTKLSDSRVSAASDLFVAITTNDLCTTRIILEACKEFDDSHKNDDPRLPELFKCFTVDDDLNFHRLTQIIEKQASPEMLTLIYQYNPDFIVNMESSEICPENKEVLEILHQHYRNTQKGQKEQIPLKPVRVCKNNGNSGSIRSDAQTK